MNDDMSNIAYTSEYLEKFSDAYNKTLTPGCTIEEERRDLMDLKTISGISKK